MTGPEHYKEAERIVAAAADAPSGVDVTGNLAAAQVHATLALVAATVSKKAVDQTFEWLQAGVS